MKTATFIKSQTSGSGADQRLYKLSESVQVSRNWLDDDEADEETTEYVIVSALRNAFDTGGPETYIFPADETGEIIAWGELDGSARGVYDHDRVLAKAGFKVVYPVDATTN